MTLSDQLTNDLYDLVHDALRLEESITRFLQAHTEELMQERITGHLTNGQISIDITLRDLHSALEGATNHLGSMLIEQGTHPPTPQELRDDDAGEG